MALVFGTSRGGKNLPRSLGKNLADAGRDGSLLTGHSPPASACLLAPQLRGRPTDVRARTTEADVLSRRETDDSTRSYNQQMVCLESAVMDVTRHMREGPVVRPPGTSRHRTARCSTRRSARPR